MMFAKVVFAEAWRTVEQDVIERLAA